MNTEESNSDLRASQASLGATVCGACGCSGQTGGQALSTKDHRPLSASSEDDSISFSSVLVNAIHEDWWRNIS